MTEQSLTIHEIERLTSGLVDLTKWGDNLLVPFSVQKLKRAEVLWINPRWFMERGFDVLNKSTRNRVEHWLISEFAYAARSEGDNDDAFEDEIRTATADRYGNTSGYASHGGSGRVATFGCFQAKGVGATPLTGVGSDWLHSNGCAWVEEGVREAIFSEIASAEFPHSAVPIIAIIDTKLTATAPPGCKEPSGRRAIVIRPAVIRPAHFQRAPAHVHSIAGYRPSPVSDVRRVREVVNRFSPRGVGGSDGKCNLEIKCTQLFRCIAEQAAFGLAHRLYNGGYFSSNISIAGELLDFGAMRALPHWAKARVLKNALGYGDELGVINGVIDSIIFYINKYGSEYEGQIDASIIQRHAKEAFDQAFDSECVKIWGLDEKASPDLKKTVIDATRAYYLYQQRQVSDYQHMEVINQPWIYDDLRSQSVEKVLSSESNTMEMKTAKTILAAIRESFGENEVFLQKSKVTASRFFCPRWSIFREELQRDLFAVLSKDVNAQYDKDRIASEIVARVDVARRHWPRISPDYVIYGHVSDSCSSALLYFDVDLLSLRFWLQAVKLDSYVVIFSQRVSIADLDRIGGAYDQHYWYGSVDAASVNPILGGRLHLQHDVYIHVPPLSILYSEPPNSV